MNDEAAKISKAATYTIQNTSLRLISLSASIRMHALSAVTNKNYNLATIKEKIKLRTFQQVVQHSNNIEQLEAKHILLNPENTFKRGFSFSTIDGTPLLSKKAKAGNNLSTYSLNQIIESTITSVKKNGKI